MNENTPPKPHRGRMFHDLRKRKDLSLQALGDAIGVDPSTISRWESHRDFHQFTRFVMALHKLGTTPEAFFSLEAPAQLETLPQPEEPELAAAGHTARPDKWGM